MRIQHLPAAAFVLLFASVAATGQSYGTIPSQMLTINATNAQVSIPDAPSLVPPIGYTIEAWFYFNPAAPGGINQPTIVCKSTNPVPTYFLRTATDSGGALHFYANWNGSLNSGVAISNTPTPTNSWHHVAGTHDGVIARLFLDGVEVGNAPSPGPPYFEPGALLIGKSGATSLDTWKGQIDAVRLWSTPRTAAEIDAARHLRITSAPNLVSAWYFDGNYLDSVGGNHGTPNMNVSLIASTSPVQMAHVTAPAAGLLGDPITFQCATIFPSTIYAFDLSLGGSAPGFNLPSPLVGKIPLNLPWINYSFGAVLPPEWFVNFIGATDANGAAAATFLIPDLPYLTGLSVTGALTLFDAGSPFGILAVSNPRTVLVTGPPPTVTQAGPSYVPVAGGVTVTVTGTGFLPGSTVKIGNAPAGSVQLTSPTTLTCVAPSRPPGTYAVVVTNPDGMSGTLPSAVTYVPPLSVALIQPGAAPAGNPVTISGAGFTPFTTATLNGAVLPLILHTPTTLAFLTPPGVSCDATIVVAEPATGGMQPKPWNVSPTITSVGVGSGPATGGTSFTLSGSNFVYGSSVTVGGSPATVVSGTTTTLTCISPPGIVGPAAIVVTSPTGCTAGATFTYL